MLLSRTSTVLLAAIVTCSCTYKKDEKVTSSQNDNKYISEINLEDVITSQSENNPCWNISKEDLIKLQTTGDPQIDEIYNFALNSNRLALWHHEQLYTVILPSGRIQGIVSTPSNVDVCFNNDTTGVLIQKGRFLRNWKDGATDIKFYNFNGKVSEKKILPSYSNIVCESDSSLLTINSVFRGGGNLYLYRLDNNFNKIDSVSLPETVKPDVSFYTARRILNDGEGYYTILGDSSISIYSISPNLEINKMTDIEFNKKMLWS